MVSSGYQEDPAYQSPVKERDFAAEWALLQLINADCQSKSRQFFHQKGFLRRVPR